MKQITVSQKIYLGFVFLLLYAPIVFLIMYSFNSGESMANFRSFSFIHYVELFQDKRLLVIVLQTIVIALLSAVISTILGIVGALAIYFTKQKRRRELYLSLNNVLIVSPDVIIGASFLILFTFLGIQLGFISVLLSHIAFSIPIVVLMILPKLYDMSPTLIDAARDLGASAKDVLFRVILPFIQPGIWAGFFLALTYSLDDFAVTFFVTGNGFTTLSVEIYSMARTGVSLTINALSAIIFLVTVALVLGYHALRLHAQRKGGGTQ